MNCSKQGSLNPNICSNKTVYHDLSVIKFNFISLFCIGMPLIIFGITSSCMTFIMFLLDRFTPKTTKLFLKILSIVDLLFLMNAVIYIELKVIYQYYPHLVEVLCPVRNQVILSTINTIIINICEMFRNLLTVLIGIERYLVTCHPLNILGTNKFRSAIYGISICFVLTVLLRVPIFLRTVTSSSNRSSIISLSNLAYKTHNVIDSIFLQILPVLLLLFCSIRITNALNASKGIYMNTKNAPQRLKSQIKKIKVTRMLVIIISIFSFCGLPSIVYTITYNVYQDDCNLMNKITTRFAAICWLFSISYSTSNFFVYVIYMPKYRIIIGHMLKCHCHKYSSVTTPFKFISPVIRMQNLNNRNLLNTSNRLNDAKKISGIILLEHALKLDNPDDHSDDSD